MTILEAIRNHVHRVLRSRRTRVLMRQAPKSIGKDILFR